MLYNIKKNNFCQKKYSRRKKIFSYIIPIISWQNPFTTTHTYKQTINNKGTNFPQNNKYYSNKHP